MSEIIKQIIQLAKHNNDIAVLWLYGSRATATHHVNSDYDLAIAFKNFLNNPLESCLRPQTLALEWQSILQLKEQSLSIVDINSIPIVLAYEIIQYNKVLFCREVKRLWREENRIYGRMELDILYSMKHYV